MRLESVAVRVLTRDLDHRVRHHEAVMASAVSTTVRDHEKFLVFLVFLRFSCSHLSTQPCNGSKPTTQRARACPASSKELKLKLL